MSVERRSEQIFRGVKKTASGVSFASVETASTAYETSAEFSLRSQALQTDDEASDSDVEEVDRLTRMISNEVTKSLDSNTRSIKAKSDASCHSAKSGPSTASSRSSRQATRDIFHPDFWNADIDDILDEEEPYPIASDQSSMTKNPSVGDILKSIDGESPLQTCDDSDSVVSDITDTFMINPTEKEETKPKSTTSSKSANKKCLVSYSVRFDNVTVREYERILGDNPACTKGPSVSIGWKYLEYGGKIHKFEAVRGRRRTQNQLILSRRKREELLTSWGFTHEEIAEGVRENVKARNRRQQTTDNLGGQKMEEALEKAKRKMKNIFLR